MVVICIALTGVLFDLSLRSQTAAASAEFRRLTEDGVRVLQTRMSTYLQSLRGAAAFVAASDNVSVDDFESFITTLDVSQQLPSIGSIGLVVEVPDAETARFESQMRREGQPEFALQRLADADLHYIVKYVQPKEGNARVLGLDLGFSADREETLMASRYLRAPQLTQPIQLLTEDHPRPGFVLLMPIYAKAMKDSETDGFLGWINATFMAENLLSDLTGGQGVSFDIRVVDGPVEQEAALIFDGRDDQGERGKFSKSYQLDHFGRTWTVLFESKPHFDEASGTYLPLAIVIAGLIVTVSLVSVFRNVRRRSASLREISELRADQIKAREEENRSVVENAVTSVLLIDGAERVLFANQAAQQCFGYLESEMRNIAFSSFAGPVKGSQKTHNAIGTTKTGKSLELDLQRNTWKTSDGQTRTTVIIRDLTEQNLAQRELNRSKALYDMALQGAGIGIFDLDLVTGSSDVSDTWCRIMGYDAGHVGVDTQKSFLSRIHLDDVSILKQADKDCIEGKTERSVAEYRLRTREGDWCWMRSDAVVAEWDENGKALRLIGTQMDVTELRHDRNALEASEKLFRQVIQNAPIGMALMDDTGRFIGVNSAFAGFTGVRELDLLATGRMSDLIPKEDRKKIFNAVDQMMSSNEANVYTAEHRILQAEGEERWGLLNVSWVFDKNKGRNLFIAQVIDVTDQKKLDKIKDEFVSTVSHELRTPLTSIKGALGLLIAGKNNTYNTSQARLIDIASSNADRLIDIVNDILDLEKISSGEVTFDFADLDLGEIMNAVEREMSPFALTHDSTLRIDIPQDPLVVLADHGRTKQVLVNLMSNACKYSKPDSEVMIKAERIDGMAIIYVQNVGSGIPESFRSHIFKAFSQADSSDTRAKGGTGLGLNITRQIVLRHGGQIGFESVPGGVTVFWFTLPLSKAEKQTIPKDDPVLIDAPGHKQAVLHVEDDPDFAEIVAESLQEHAVVSHAKSVAMARQVVLSTRLDVVILDWSLPDGDAGRLLDEIIAQQPHVRVIGLSADNDRPHDSRLFANLTKGRTELSTIVDSVNRCLSLAS